MNTAPNEGAQESTPISGVKLTFTAKGLLQPEITVRYRDALYAMQDAAADAFAIYDHVVRLAHERGVKLVTEQA